MMGWAQQVVACEDESLVSEPQSLHDWEGYSVCMKDKLSVWCRREKLSVFALQMTGNKTQTVLYRAPTSLFSLHHMVHGIYSCADYLL